MPKWKVTNGKVATVIHLTEQQRAFLDEKASELGCSLSEVIRRLVDLERGAIGKSVQVAALIRALEKIAAAK